MSDSKPSAEAGPAARGSFTAADVMILLGMLAVVAGVALIYIPAALITAGVALVWVGARGDDAPAAAPPAAAPAEE